MGCHPPEMLSAIEAEVLKNINQVMRLHAQPPLGVLADLFEVSEDSDSFLS